LKNQHVLLSGASGMIGSSVERALRANSIHVVKLIRRRPGEEAPSGRGAISWDPTSSEPAPPAPNPLAAATQLDAAIHLSGANVAARRWTAGYKREIVESRVGTTRALCRLLAGRWQRPEVLVCASAIGIYGDRGDQVLDETSSPGEGFLADTCREWESATREAEDAGIRVVHARFGVVLDPAGGALGKLLPLFRLGMGGKLGSGRQWMSWIGLRDVVQILLHCAEDASLRGPVNVTSPNPVTNSAFTCALGKALHRPAVLGVPAFALRMAVGGMADEGLLSSCRAVPAKLNAVGFHFEDPSLGPALESLLA